MLWFTAEVTATAALEDFPFRTCESRVLADEGAAPEGEPERTDSRVPAWADAALALLLATASEADAEAAVPAALASFEAREEPVS
jgi:hypothetical protein